MAASSDGKGYWLVASDGGVFNYGDAAFDGSTGAIHLNKPIVGMAATPDGQGLLAGGLRRRASSTTATPPSTGRRGPFTSTEPIVGMAATPDGKGYWLAASDGGVFTEGDAPFYGSMAG